MKKLYLLFAVLLCATTSAFSQDTQKDLFDGRLLDVAREEIQSLDLEGARALADALAECAHPYDTSGVARGCRVRTSRFTTEFRTGFALERLMVATVDAAGMTRDMPSQERGRYYSRMSVVSRLLSEATTKHFEQLRHKKNKQPT